MEFFDFNSFFRGDQVSFFRKISLPNGNLFIIWILAGWFKIWNSSFATPRQIKSNRHKSIHLSSHRAYSIFPAQAAFLSFFFVCVLWSHGTVFSKNSKWSQFGYIGFNWLCVRNRMLNKRKLRERQSKRKNVENNFFMWMCSWQDGKKKNPDKREKWGAIIHMSTIYVFFFLIFWRLTKQQYLSISGVVCVCSWDVIFSYVMHHIDATRSHHGAYIIVCAYIIIRNLGSFVRTFGRFFCSFSELRAHTSIYMVLKFFVVFSFEQCTRSINTFDDVNGKQ